MSFFRKTSGMFNKIWQSDNKHDEERPRTEGFLAFEREVTVHIPCT